MFDAVGGGEGGTGAVPTVLTVEEVADVLRVDRKTAYAAIAEGRVPGVRRVGRCIRVSRDALLKWIEEGTTQTRSGRVRQ